MSLTLVKPLPTKEQLKYQQDELIAFIHFGVNTFTDKECGDGNEDPSIFNPTELDTDQWARILYKAGFKKIILTAKHHDGFCLWPSKYTEHSVKNSPWKNGQGDVVKDLHKSCKKYGLQFGIYLSPWDQNSSLYGSGNAYNKYYLNQLRELMNNYGPISEIWLDDVKDSDVEQEYDWDSIYKTIKEINPSCIIFSHMGPDARGVGNETGYAGKPCYSTIDLEVMRKAEVSEYLNHGDSNGKYWVVTEADVSLRPGWFYHKDEDNKIKTLEQLKNIYFNSVGNNAVLLLNFSPNKKGKLHDNDINTITSFGQYLKNTFSDNLIKGSTVIATNDSISDAYKIIDDNYDTYWQSNLDAEIPYIEINFDEEKEFNIIQIQEYIPLGQNIDEFKIYAFKNNGWFQLYNGKTIGYKHIAKIPRITTSRIKISFLEYNEPPAINNVAIYNDGI